MLVTLLENLTGAFYCVSMLRAKIPLSITVFTKKKNQKRSKIISDSFARS